MGNVQFFKSYGFSGTFVCTIGDHYVCTIRKVNNGYMVEDNSYGVLTIDRIKEIKHILKIANKQLNKGK